MFVTFIIVHIILGTWQHFPSHPCYVARTVPMLALYSVSMRCQCCVNAVSMLSHSLYPGCFGIPGLAVQQLPSVFIYDCKRDYSDCKRDYYDCVFSAVLPIVNVFAVFSIVNNSIRYSDTETKQAPERLRRR